MSSDASVSCSEVETSVPDSEIYSLAIFVSVSQRCDALMILSEVEHFRFIAFLHTF